MSSDDSDADSTRDGDGAQTLQLDVPSGGGGGGGGSGGGALLNEVDIGEGDDLSGHSGAEDYLATHSPALREQDRFLPIGIVPSSSHITPNLFFQRISHE